tara:strand:- start:1137 stop:2828 length:1692 start_codon:yes stop_codon:yes gene_type:complete
MNDNKILALKYRPQEFKDLIGQEVMAQTITNAIKLGKTPNAYLLTGIRGVGKTTTARLIAKALNCQKNTDKKIDCTINNFCNSCKDIISSNHLDVLEMDAASKTGIDDVRELIENAKYSPTSAKFKIFIIDEVHMLSKQAFNGLLKTLEEPPPSLKFILATTEVRKIPVTILSRCQRFDLKRVEIKKLFDHLKKISKIEKGKISDNAIKILANASEGSVRDAISLLDRALIFQTINPEKEIEDHDVREMLGLVDRDKMLSLFKEILEGNEKKALIALKEMINNGVDTKNFLNDILEILYFFSRRLNLGKIENDLTISDNEISIINEYSKNLDMQDIGLFWQLTLKTLDDLKILADENLALEMYIMQLIHLKKMDKNAEVGTYKKEDEEIKIEQKFETSNKNNDTLNLNVSNPTTNQLKNTEQIKSKTLNAPKVKIEKNKIVLENFLDLIKLVEEKKEIELKYDLERNVSLVSFSRGKIDISFNEKLNKNFIKNLTEKLLVWTGERWIISLSQEIGQKTLYENRLENSKNEFISAKNNKITKEVMDYFSDAEISRIEKMDKKDD